MDEATDLSYYVGAGANPLSTIDIVIASGDIVSIDELPDDPNELISFLEAEKCAVKYWTLVLQAYVKIHRVQESVVIAEKGLLMPFFTQPDIQILHTLLRWLYLMLAGDGIDQAQNLDKADAQPVPPEAADSTDVLLAQAQSFLYRDNAEGALRIYDRLLKQDPNNCLAILGKANVTLSKTQNYTNALKLFQQVLVINPILKPDPRIGIGICFWFLKDREMAISAWKRALDLDPSNYKARVLLNFASFDTVFTNSLSDDLFLQGYKSSLEELSKLQLQKPSESTVLLALCSFYYSKDRFDLVEKIVTKVVSSVNSGQQKLSRFSSKVLSNCSFWLGRVAYSKNDFTQSQKYFHEAIRFDENNLLAKLGLGQSQLSRNSNEEAVITFESILKTNPKCLEVIYSLGLLYSESKSKTKQEQAIQLLERYVRLSDSRGTAVANKSQEEAFLNKEPVALNAYLTLSKLYEPRDVAQSLTYLHKAIESRQTISKGAPLEIYNNIAVFNFSKGNTVEAEKNFALALETLEKSEIPAELKSDLKISLSYNIARTRESKDLDKAVEMYKEILEEFPNYFSAKLRLLFLDAVLTNKLTKKEIDEEIKQLLEETPQIWKPDPSTDGSSRHLERKSA